MRYIFILLLSIQFLSGYAQDAKNSVDQQLEKIRDFAFEQNDYPQAISLTRESLQTFPDNYSLGILLCRLLFWSGDHDQAMENTENFLTVFPNEIDPHFLKIDILESQNKYSEAQEFIASIEGNFKDDQMLKFRKAYNLSVLKEYKKSKTILKEILIVDPEHQKAKQLLKDLKKQSSRKFIAAGYHLFRPVEELVEMRQYHLSFGQQINKSTFIGKLNVREIEGERGLQGQVEWYQTLTKNIYTHSYFAQSNSELLAKYRYGVGLYAEYKNGMQYSFTASRLHTDITTLSLFSAGLVKRHRQMSVQSKLFYVDSEINSSKFAYLLGLRRYLNETDMYFGVNYGLLPQENIQVLQQPNNLHARFIGMEFSYPYKNQYEFKLNFNMNLQKFATQRDQLLINLKYYF